MAESSLKANKTEKLRQEEPQTPGGVTSGLNTMYHPG
jgi:hypothetical protein